MSPETIQKLLKSREGVELKEFIAGQLKILDRISDIPDDWTEQQKALEVTARKRAAQMLAAILKPFLDYQEPQNQPQETEDGIYHSHLAKQ